MTGSIISIRDVGYEELATHRFDISIFASGYEQRARHVAKVLGARKLGNALVFGFTEHLDEKDRKENDEAFARVCADSILQSYDDDGEIIKALSACFSQRGGRVRVLVDYTSMTRTWFSAVLNWFRFNNCFDEAELFFAYSVGNYDGKYPYRVIRSVVAIPGCEGHPDPSLETVAIFGLGHDGLTPLAIIEDIEPSETFAFVASPSVDANSDMAARRENQAFLEYIGSNLVAFPLMSVRQTYSGLVELISPFVGKANVILIPMGPKPHILASVLCAMNRPEVSCLHAKGSPAGRIGISAHGAISACCVVIKHA